jgi:hypothetical protein
MKAAPALVVFFVAVVVRAAAAVGIGFPIPEDSAYYVTVANNLLSGRGLVTDALWSYATPPLVVPRPAFDLWQPLASLAMAPVMAVSGRSLVGAQATTVVAGAITASLAVVIAHRASADLGLSAARAQGVGLTAGMLVALAPVLVIQSAEPDSSTVYTLLAVGACAAMPGVLAERWRVPLATILLGVTIGAAYLARSEGVYLALVFIALVWYRRGDDPHGARQWLRPALAVSLAASIVVAPWIVRQAGTWQGPPFQQLIENAWWVRRTDVFAWADRPSLASYLAIGPAALVDLRLHAFTADVILLLVGAWPAAVIGFASVLARPSLVSAASLRPLLLIAVLTFLVDVLAFPVAGTVGLWAHGAGPAIVLMAIPAAFGLDAVIARLGAVLSWRPSSGAFPQDRLIAPLAVVILGAPLLALAVRHEQEGSATTSAEYASLATAALGWSAPPGRPIVTDHPMWVAHALGRPALALPREPPTSIVDLARHFGAVAVVVRDDDPDVAAVSLAIAAYRDAAGRTCFPELPTVAPFRAFGFACATETASIETVSATPPEPQGPPRILRLSRPP